MYESNVFFSILASRFLYLPKFKRIVMCVEDFYNDLSVHLAIF